MAAQPPDLALLRARLPVLHPGGGRGGGPVKRRGSTPLTTIASISRPSSARTRASSSSVSVTGISSGSATASTALRPAS